MLGNSAFRSGRACLFLVLLAASQLAAQEVTCTASPTGDGGFGITEACGSTAFHNGPPLAQPPTLTSSDGVLDVVLAVRAARVDTGVFSFNSRVFCVADECGPIGPTLRFFAGDTVRVTLNNELEGSSGDGDINTLRRANMTNLHTHGLHIDPSVDNVFVSAGPGESLVYEYTIPEDHMPGLHWYHSHEHGASAYQVMGGLLGGLVVDWPASAKPASWEAMATHHIVLSHISLCSCNPTNDPFRIISYQEMATDIGEGMDLDIEIGEEGISDAYLTNGVFQPQLSMAPGEWVNFEVVNAVGDTFVELEVRTAINNGSTACNLMALGWDGVPFDAPRSVGFVPLAPAGRASLAVMCDSPGTFYFQLYPGARVCDLEAQFQQNFLTLNVEGTAVVMDTPAWSAEDITRPSYLQDLQQSTTEGEWQIGVEQSSIVGGGAWLGVGVDCELPCQGRADCDTLCTEQPDSCNNGNPDPNAWGECNYLAWGGASMDYRHVAPLCGVEDVVVQGRGKTPHPIHIHVNHFQVISAPNGYTQHWGEIGDWRDTVPAIAGATRLRHVVDRFGGAVVVHCHFLMHEDLGMMDRFWAADDGTFCVGTGGGSTGNAVTNCNNDVPQDTAFATTYAPIVRDCQSTPTLTGEEFVLGRVTNTSVTVSVLLSEHTLEGYFQWGTEQGDYAVGQSASAVFQRDEPQEVVMDGLAPNTRYYYRFVFRYPATASFTPAYTTSQNFTFITQRPPGSSFVFTIQADSHMDENTDEALYRRTLANALLDQPDFHIDLGDTPMVDKCANFVFEGAAACTRAADSYEETEGLWLRQRPVLGSLAHSAPFVFTQGNHDGEAGQFNDGTAENIAVWANLVRKEYIPNPDPSSDPFFTGSSISRPFVGMREAYVSWHWGDALFVVLDAWWFSSKGSSSDGDDKPWAQSLGEEQFRWLESTLESSTAPFKFVFVHNLVGGRCNQCGECGDSRGGIEYSHLFEWGGMSVDCSYTFDSRRPGWGRPIHQLFTETNVTAVFHGHDHVYVQQEIDGIVYHLLPQPGANNGKTSLADEYGYVGEVRPSSGHIRITVTPTQSTAEYVRSFLEADEDAENTNGMVDHTYTMQPAQAVPLTNDTLLARCEVQRQLQSKCVEPTATPVPNFVLFMPDDLANITPERPAGVDSPAGLGTPTPYLDRLRDEGAVFTRAYTSSPKCAPSRWTLLTGRYCSTGVAAREDTLRDNAAANRTNVKGSACVIDSNEYGNDYANNVAATLQAAGYHTCYAGKWHISTLGFNWNYEEDEAIVKDAGFSEAPAVWITNFAGDEPETEAFSHNMEWATAGIIQCIQNAVDQQKPFYVNFQPTIPNGDFMEEAMFNYTLRDTPAGVLAADPDIDMPSRQSMWDRAVALVESGEVVEKDLDQAAGIIWLDEGFGALARFLNSTVDANGTLLWESTFVLFTMDHGMAAKDYLYEGGARVLLHARYPPLIAEGTQVHSVVNNIDVGATILHIAGIEAGYELDGESWVDLLSDDDGSRVIVSENYFHRAVVAGRYKLLSNQGCWSTCECICTAADCTKGTCADHPYFWNATQMYDLQEDPTEQVNLVARGNWDGSLQAVLEQLQAVMSCHDLETRPLSPVEGACEGVNTTLLEYDAQPSGDGGSGDDSGGSGGSGSGGGSPEPEDTSGFLFDYVIHNGTDVEQDNARIGDNDTAKVASTNETAYEFVEFCKERCNQYLECVGFVLSDKDPMICTFKANITDRVSKDNKALYERITISASPSPTPSQSATTSVTPSPSPSASPATMLPGCDDGPTIPLSILAPLMGNVESVCLWQGQ